MRADGTGAPPLGLGAILQVLPNATGIACSAALNLTLAQEATLLEAAAMGDVDSLVSQAGRCCVLLGAQHDAASYVPQTASRATTPMRYISMQQS